MTQGLETIPKEIRDAYGQPALGWLVLRASHLYKTGDLSMSEKLAQALDIDALGILHKQAHPRYVETTSEAVTANSSRARRSLLASNQEHAVRIAVEVDIQDVPLPSSIRLRAGTDPRLLLDDIERKALEFRSLGYTLSRAARATGVSEIILSRRTTSMREKLGVDSNAQAVLVGYSLGILKLLTSKQLEPYAQYFKTRPTDLYQMRGGGRSLITKVDLSTYF